MALDWRFWPVIQDFLERPRGQLLGTHVVREADDSHTRKRGITFNSLFKSEEIDAFGRLIARKGGRLIDHVHVRRGRILNQLSGNELMERVRNVLDSRAGNWPVVGALRAPPEPDL